MDCELDAIAGTLKDELSNLRVNLVAQSKEDSVRIDAEIETIHAALRETLTGVTACGRNIDKHSGEINSLRGEISSLQQNVSDDNQRIQLLCDKEGLIASRFSELSTLAKELQAQVHHISQDIT